MEPIIIIALLIGFIMTWSVGANDLANVMSTTMGSKAVSVKQAIILAIIFEFAGAILGGSHVTNTIRHGIINPEALPSSLSVLALGMLSVLFASSTWLLAASFFGMPVSITNSIVGSLVGFGMIIVGVSAIHWNKVGLIALTWVLSPTLAGIVAFLLFKTIQKTILGTLHPLLSAKQFMPVYLLIIGVVLTVTLVIKGLHHFSIYLSIEQNVAIVLAGSTLTILAGMTVIQKLATHPDLSRHDQFIVVEKMFSVLMALTSCAMVFAHGSNDVALSVGPLVAILDIVSQQGIHEGSPLPLWIMVFGCLGVVCGLIMYGRKVIETVGSHITALTPSRAFAATLAAAIAVIISTTGGIPVSATQTLVGAVLGVGLARGIDALNLRVIRNIFTSWIITIPVAASLSIGFFFLFTKLKLF